MLTIRPKWRERREWLWPVALAGVVTWCSGQPAVVIEGAWFELDKVAHFAVYGALATAVIRCRGLWRKGLFGVVLAIGLTSGYGLADEFRQSLTAVRTFDLKDWTADTVGAVVAAALYAWWPAYRRLFEMPLRRVRRRVEIPPALTPNSAS